LRGSPACWELTLNLLKEASNDVQKAEYGIRLASKLIDSSEPSPRAPAHPRVEVYCIDSHDGADYLQLLEAEVMKCSATFSGTYRERASTLLDRLKTHR